MSDQEVNDSLNEDGALGHKNDELDDNDQDEDDQGNDLEDDDQDNVDGDDGDDNDGEGGKEKKKEIDRNGPEYVNLRGSIGRVHESELEPDEIEDLRKVELYPTSLTKGKYYHEFSESQIDVLSKIRNQVWERLNRKNNPPLPPLPKPDPETRMDHQMQSHTGQFLHHPQQMHQQPMSYPFASGPMAIHGGNQFLVPPFASNYLRMSQDPEMMAPQQSRQGKRIGGGQGNPSKKMRGYAYEDQEYGLPAVYDPSVYMQQQEDIQRRYQQLQAEDQHHHPHEPSHLFDMQI